MTKNLNITSPSQTWDLTAVYAASFGLFAPGLLMAARRQTAAAATNPTPTAHQGHTA